MHTISATDINALSKIVGSKQVSKPDDRPQAFRVIPDVVVKPKSSKEVSKIIKMASTETPIVPVFQESRVLITSKQETGGLGLNLGAMENVVKVDKDNLYVTTEPGASWKKLNLVLSKKKLFLPVYPFTTADANVGDWVITGGVGVGSYKYGGMEQQVRSLEIILADGKIISTGCKNVVNNSSGYNLTDLFVGSEGKLGIITKITLKAYPQPTEIRPAAYVYPNFQAAAKGMAALTKINTAPYHISYLDTAGMKLEGQRKKEAAPDSTIVSVGFSGESKIIDIEEAAVDKVMAGSGGKKTSKVLAAREWNDRFFETRLSSRGPLFLIGFLFCPIPQLSKFRNDALETLKKIKVEGTVSGIICDRNTAVVLVFGITEEKKVIKNKSSVANIRKLFDGAFKLGGRPGGFGMRFGDSMKRVHGKGLDVLDDIKANLDPDYIFNP